MTASIRSRTMLWAGAVLLIAGCAPAYHHYADCHVNCNYCPPPPLRYPHYPECVCHSSAATPYLQSRALTIDPGEETSGANVISARAPRPPKE